MTVLLAWASLFSADPDRALQVAWDWQPKLAFAGAALCLAAAGPRTPPASRYRT